MFQTHQCDVLRECEIPVNIFREVCEPRDGHCVKHDPYFDSHPIPSKLMKTKNCLIEGVLRLYDIVVDCRIKCGKQIGSYVGLIPAEDSSAGH